jgi:hypothetical protein
MTARALLSGTSRAASALLLAAYALLLVPVLIFGFAAYSDHQGLGCPGPGQCEDAETVMRIAALYVLAASAVLLLFWAARRGEPARG